MNKENKSTAQESSSFEWKFWLQILVAIIVVKLVGLLGGLIVWGTWSLITFIINKVKASKTKTESA